MAQAIGTPRFRGRPYADARRGMRPEAAPHPQHFRGRQHAATILVVVLLAVVGFQVFPRHEVMVLSNGSAVRISATFNPRNEGLAAAAVKLGPGDRVLYGTGGRHASVAVQRARDIEVQVDGKIVDVHTQATTIGGVLAEVGITLQPADRVMLNGQATTEHGPLTGPSLVYAGNAVPFQATGNAGSIDGQITIVRARPITVMIDTKEVDTMSAAATVTWVNVSSEAMRHTCSPRS